MLLKIENRSRKIISAAKNPFDIFMKKPVLKEILFVFSGQNCFGESLKGSLGTFFLCCTRIFLMHAGAAKIIWNLD